LVVPVGFDFLEQVKQYFSGFLVGQIQTCLPQRLPGLVEFANTKQLITEQKLQIRIKRKLLSLLNEVIYLLEKHVSVVIQSAREEGGFVLGCNPGQRLTQSLSGLNIPAVSKEGLGVGKRQYNIIRRQIHCLGELYGSDVEIICFKSPDSIFEEHIGWSFLGGFFSFLLGKSFTNVRESILVDRFSTLGRLVVLCWSRGRAIVVIVGVIIVGIASDFTGDGVVAVPGVRVTPIPVIAHIPIARWPVATETDKDIFAVVIRVNVSKGKPRPPVVIHHKAVSGPDYLAAYPAVQVSVYVLMTEYMVYYACAFAIGSRCRTCSEVVAAGHASSVGITGFPGAANNGSLVDNAVFDRPTVSLDTLFGL